MKIFQACSGHGRSPSSTTFSNGRRVSLLAFPFPIQLCRSGIGWRDSNPASRGVLRDSRLYPSSSRSPASANGTSGQKVNELG